MQVNIFLLLVYLKSIVGAGRKLSCSQYKVDFKSNPAEKTAIRKS